MPAYPKQPGHACRLGGAHLRGIALELRDLANKCRFPRARLEVRDLAVRFERRADHFDEAIERRADLIRKLTPSGIT
jgi:hypothetical protein